MRSTTSWNQARAEKMQAAGHSRQEIARYFGIGRRTVERKLPLTGKRPDLMRKAVQA